MDHMSTTTAAVSSGQELSRFLETAGLPFRYCSPYLLVGETETGGPVLHLSVVLSQLEPLLETVLPILKEAKIPFKIPASRSVHSDIVSGNLGYSLLGKSICIFPAREEDWKPLCAVLVERTQGFKGPSIENTVHLGGIVYANHPSAILSSGNGRTEVRAKEKTGYSRPLHKRSPKKILQGSYLPLLVLKNDTKGRVVKALDVRSWWKVDWCIIKEGKKHMCSDEEGRDIRDRLRWQYEVHKELQEMIRIPRVHDFLEISGESFLVMEFIPGSSLTDRVFGIYDGYNWNTLPIERKMELGGYLRDIVTGLEIMHLNGFVHRDLNPHNFLITGKGQICFIDLELCHSYLNRKPLPPFRLGTIGFMSPEQEASLPPEPAQDIYGLGALMIFLLTGLYPSRFAHGDISPDPENLIFFTGNQDIAELIASSLSRDPGKRPCLSEVRSRVQTFFSQISPSASGIIRGSLDLNRLETFIENALKTFSAAPYIGTQGFWISKDPGNQEIIANESFRTETHAGLARGVAGVIYLLSEAKKAGFSIAACQGAFDRNLSWLTENFLFRQSGISGGLYHGSAGISYALLKAAKAGMKINEEGLIRDLGSCFCPPTGGLSLAEGVAGQALASMEAMGFLPQNLQTDLHREYRDYLLQRQKPDGHWDLFAYHSRADLNALSLAKGHAGMICTLLKDWELDKNAGTEEYLGRSIEWFQKATLRYLKKNAPDNRQIKMERLFLDHGYAGISLAFIRAYKSTRQTEFRLLAERILHLFPPTPAYNCFHYSSGLAGLGEVYLEAFQVFGSEEWLQRACWIANLFLHTGLRTKEGSIFWLPDHGQVPTADLWSGNGGILHFLMRYCRPSKLGMALFD
jgi:serine/threonine protein kinase